jgi:hypothetical protein
LREYGGIGLNRKGAPRRTLAMDKSWGLTAALMLIGSLGVSAVTGTQEQPYRETVVVQWNTTMLQAIRNTGSAPTFAARSLAILHTCIFDTWAAYDSRAVSTEPNWIPRQSGRSPANKEEAISYAAYTALSDLFPSQRASILDPRMAQLGYDPQNASSRPAGIGIQACEAVLASRHADGANQLGNLSGGSPYSDYTGYVPANDPLTLVDPNRWQPLQNADGSAQVFLAPHWRNVKPFALRAPDQFRPAPPARFGTIDYEQQAQEIVSLSASLNDRRKAIALYWADGPRSETPPGHWNLFAQFVSKRDRHTLEEDVKMFFLLGNAALDASIAVWDCKVAYDYVRPVSAIRFLYRGRAIEAWAGPGRGTQVINGEAFRSYIGTPPFAEYTSGHSAFSAASAEILTLFTGSDVLGASHTILAGSSSVEPGLAPSRDVILSWRTFQEAANEAGLSRRYGGIHFTDGDLASRTMGRKIGQAVWEKAKQYFNETRAGRKPT